MTPVATMRSAGRAHAPLMVRLSAWTTAEGDRAPVKPPRGSRQGGGPALLPVPDRACEPRGIDVGGAVDADQLAGQVERVPGATLGLLAHLVPVLRRIAVAGMPFAARGALCERLGDLVGLGAEVHLHEPALVLLRERADLVALRLLEVRLDEHAGARTQVRRREREDDGERRALDERLELVAAAEDLVQAL